MKRLPLILSCLLFTGSLAAQQYDPLQKEKQKQMQAQTDRCRDNITTIGGATHGAIIPGIRNFIGGCQFSAVNEQDIVLGQIRSMGIDTPLYFANAEEARREQLRKTQAQGDQLILSRNLVRFDQSSDPNPTVTSAANTLGEAGVRLSGDVKDIMLQLQDSLSTREFLRNPQNQYREGMEDVLKLAWMWDHIGAATANCGGTRVDSDSDEVRNIMWNKPGRVLPPAQLFFGLKSEQDLTKMNAFKWEQGPHVRYLFNAAGKGFEENWVLAEYDRTTGDVRFTHFQMVRSEKVDPPPGTAGTTPGGATAAIPLNMSLIDGRDQLGVSGWVGASLQTNNTRLPWGQSVTLPTGVINLAQVQLTQSTGNVRSSQTITATNKDVSLNNTVVPSDTTSWDLQTRASVQTQTGNWSAGAGVRVYNVMVGYDTNSGKDHSVNMTVVDGNNYVKYDNNTKSAGRVTMGRMWENKKGGVAYSFDAERRSHRIELVVLF